MNDEIQARGVLRGEIAECWSFERFQASSGVQSITDAARVIRSIIPGEEKQNLCVLPTVQVQNKI